MGYWTALVIGLLLFAVLVFPLLMFDAGLVHGHKTTQAEAIKAGVGEYVVDPKTGETSFRFMACDHRKPYGPPSPQRPGAIGSAE